MDAFQTAQKEWGKGHAEGPYTSLRMVKYLIDQSGRSLKDFVSNPHQSLKEWTFPQTLEHVRAQHRKKSPELELTWNSKTGRCTALALKVSGRLEEKGPDTFRFEHFNMTTSSGGHRLSRCRKTGVVIDSSSTVGAAMVPEAADWILVGNMKCKFDGSQSWTEIPRSGKQILKKSPPITHEEAQAHCLSEVAQQVPLITYFRSFQNGLPKFHGMMKFRLDTKGNWRQLELMPDPWVKDGQKHTGCIVWNQDGTAATDAECREVMEGFIITHGGGNVLTQWHADGCDAFFWEIWDQLNMAYGYPTFTRAEANTK